MLDEQVNYVLASNPVTHRVEADVSVTLQKVYNKVVELWQRFGPDARIMVTVSAHVPAKKPLVENVEETK
jgi:hypothetical protein